MPDDNQGVTAEASTANESGLGSGSSDTGGQEANPTVPSGNEGSVDAGAEDSPANLTDDELANIPDQWRDRFSSLHKGYKSLEADHKPLKAWVDQRGGLDYVQTDVELMDKLFSENPDERREFYQGLYQDSAAFERFMSDITTDPGVQAAVLQNIDPNELLRYVEGMGLVPQNSTVDPGVLATIPQDLQEVFRLLPPAVQEEYALMQPAIRDWNLKRDAQIHYSQQREQQQAKQARDEAAYQQKSKVYNDVRSIIQQSLTQIFPANEQAMNFVLSATETALYQSEEGAALWNELEAMVDRGNVRGIREKLPLIVAKAKSIATQQATWLNERESKARQFDELMRLSNYDDIIAHVNRLRGGMRQPSPGTTPQPNGNGLPKPDMAGQYDPANVLSYFPRT